MPLGKCRIPAGSSICGASCRVKRGLCGRRDEPIIIWLQQGRVCQASRLVSAPWDSEETRGSIASRPPVLTWPPGVSDRLDCVSTAAEIALPPTFALRGRWCLGVGADFARLNYHALDTRFARTSLVPPSDRLRNRRVRDGKWGSFGTSGAPGGFGSRGTRSSGSFIAIGGDRRIPDAAASAGLSSDWLAGVGHSLRSRRL